jgi:hypothetical protein
VFDKNLNKNITEPPDKVYNGFMFAAGAAAAAGVLGAGIGARAYLSSRDKMPAKNKTLSEQSSNNGPEQTDFDLFKKAWDIVADNRNKKRQAPEHELSV